ncbi:hypothetical protein [Rufibacter hautae]|uniref:Uncharacterized protein n=1 Tax=Rufibacter hautae TaxID=2595005 RepID=A0A5B6TDC0_9BACT|nr:hypothetical protein [Rufibacter hautae]KAA3438457.1 hypothetical protein FOA19_14575 [Rufibacter hautae]
MTKIKGFKLRGGRYTGINLADIPGAYFWMVPSENTAYFQGLRIQSIRSLINGITLTGASDRNVYETTYQNGRPYITTIDQAADITDGTRTNWNFLH